MVAADENKLPTGPTPANWPEDKNNTPYDPATAETFSFNITGFDYADYDIEVTLETSNYKGFAVNFGNNDYKDFEFLKSDYVK